MFKYSARALESKHITEISFRMGVTRLLGTALERTSIALILT